MAKLVYGVFPVARCWKLYAEGRRTRTFIDRQAAICAAMTDTRSSLATGLDVDLYVQQPSGELQKIERASLGH